MTRAEAAEMLGITVRQFKRREAAEPIAGTITHGSGPTARKLYPEAVIDALVIDSAEEEQQGAVAALMKQTAVSAREVFETGGRSLRSSVEMVEKVVPFLLSELQRQGESLKAAQTEVIEALKLTRDFIIEQAKLEAESLKREADQTITVERSRAMLEGVKTLVPIAKATVARKLGMPELVRDAESESVSRLVHSLKPAQRDQLLEGLDEESRNALLEVFGYTEARERLGANLDVLRKLREKPEQLQRLAPLLDTQQQASLMALLADGGAPTPAT